VFVVLESHPNAHVRVPVPVPVHEFRPAKTRRPGLVYGLVYGHGHGHAYVEVRDKR
jgi:hypothetical protein